MKPRLALAAAGLLALGMLTAGGVAFAAGPSPTTATSSPAAAGKDIVLPAGGALAARTIAFCARSGDLADRLAERETRISAKTDDPAATRAKQEKRVADLRKHDRDKRADALATRIERRAKRVAALPDRAARVKAAATECTSLGLS